MRKPLTSSRVSGPPMFNINTPVFGFGTAGISSLMSPAFVDDADVTDDDDDDRREDTGGGRSLFDEGINLILASANPATKFLIGMAALRSDIFIVTFFY